MTPSLTSQRIHLDLIFHIIIPHKFNAIPFPYSFEMAAKSAILQSPKSLCCKFEQQLLDKPAHLKYFSEFAKVNQNNYKRWDHNAAFSLISLWPLDHHGNITFSQNLEWKRFRERAQGCFKSTKYPRSLFSLSVSSFAISEASQSSEVPKMAIYQNNNLRLLL